MRFSVIIRPKFSSTLLGAFLIKNDNSVKRLLLGVIRFYQKFISPALPPSCRFYPTCSHYGYEAIEKYGPIKGGWLATKRISRCHPFNPGGHDPVP